MVFFSVPVMRSTARTELPSQSMCRQSSARSTGSRMSPSTRSGRCENVLRQLRQRNRWLPLRSLPKRLPGIRHSSQFIGAEVVAVVSVTMYYMCTYKAWVCQAVSGLIFPFVFRTLSV